MISGGIILLWLLLGLWAGAMIVRKRHAGLSGFVLGIILGPIGLAVAMFLEVRDD